MTARTVPGALQAHLNGAATTTCRLLKFTLTSGQVFGITTLDQSIDYDDGEGEITYVASNGFDPSALSAATGGGVDNAEAFALLSDEVPGITEEMVNRGELDDAAWVCYLVNFRDTSQGHVILGAGDVGENRMRWGVLWLPELLSYVMRLKQPIGGVWSLRCRAVFGSPADSPTGCGVDISALWTEGEVEAVGAESDREFTADTVGSPSPYPGRVEFLTGDNQGIEYAVEGVAGLVVSLQETTRYPIQIGDTFRIRPDCGKRFLEDCIGVWANGVNFKGEPHIPVGDAAQIQTPGAKVPGAGPRFTSGS